VWACVDGCVGVCGRVWACVDVWECVDYERAWMCGRVCMRGCVWMYAGVKGSRTTYDLLYNDGITQTKVSPQNIKPANTDEVHLVTDCSPFFIATAYWPQPHHLEKQNAQGSKLEHCGS